MLDLEQLLSDLRDLEHELNSMGVEAVLDERDDGMPEFHFGEFGGGLDTIRKGSVSPFGLARKIMFLRLFSTKSSATN